MTSSHHECVLGGERVERLKVGESGEEGEGSAELYALRRDVAESIE